MIRVVTIIWLCLVTAMSCCGAGPDIEVNTSLSPLTAPAISPLLYSHNIRWVENGDYLWDTTRRAIKSGALQIVREVSSIKPATLRFPGGHWADEYRWRRGVGPVEKRPDEWVYYSMYCDHANAFGTDELMAFARSMSPYTRLLISVNWFLFNSDSGGGGDPAAGAQEAANWVEYCNGVVTSDLLLRARRAGWRPSRFVLNGDPNQESTGCDAQEWADGITCWRSTERAPKGYFAWLRYDFAYIAGKPDPGPYGVQYWEIGNEHYDVAPSEYQGSVIDYGVAMKKANSSRSVIRDTGATIQEQDPYQGRYMKIGATLCIAFGPNDPCSAWTRSVLASSSAKYIDFMSVHPYCIAYPDEHYSAVLDGATPYLGENAPYVSLAAGTTYVYRVRARGVPGGYGLDAYPRISLWLERDLDGTATPLRTMLPVGDPRRFGDYEIYVQYQVGGSNIFTDMANDYFFSVTVPQSGQYRIRGETTWHPIAPPRYSEIQISFVTCTGGGQQEVPIRLCSDERQTMAFFAMPLTIGERLSDLQAYADGLTSGRKHIEMAATEYRTLFRWSGYDQDNSLKGVIGAAEMLREMMDRRFEVASFWKLHEQIAEPKRGTYDAIRGYWPNQDQSTFIRSGYQLHLKLMQEHFGDRKLTASLPNRNLETEHFDAPAYGREMPARYGVPYLSVLASGADWKSNYYRKLYVLIINKDWREPRQSTVVRLNGLKKQPTAITWYVLACRDPNVSALDAMNDYSNPNRISVTSISSRPPALASYVPYDVAYPGVLPASSITVLEITQGY